MRTQSDPPMLMSARQVRERFGVCNMTIRRWLARDPRFPRPIKLAGGNRNYFSAAAIQKYIDRHLDEVRSCG